MTVLLAVGFLSRRPEAAIAAQTTISVGHVDAFSVRIDGPTLGIYVRDFTVPGGAQTPLLRPAAEVLLVGRPESRTTVPDNPQFSFLGAPGSAVWVLPQVQNPALLWVGWDTEEISHGSLAGNSLQWTLTSVQGPGAFALFTTDQFGNPTVLFNSDAGLPASVNVPAGVHAHGNWAFKAPGHYVLSVQASATLTSGGSVTGTSTITFDVDGSGVSPPAPATAPPPAPPPAPPLAAAPATPAQAPASGGAVAPSAPTLSVAPPAEAASIPTETAAPTATSTPAPGSLLAAAAPTTASSASGAGAQSTGLASESKGRSGTLLLITVGAGILLAAAVAYLLMRRRIAGTP